MSLPHLADWLRDGSIAPLRWGDSLAEIAIVWPSAWQEAAEAKALNYPFLPLGDCLELYFGTDDYHGLQEILVKVRNIENGAPTSFLIYDGLRRKLTFTLVKEWLAKWDIDFQVEYGPHYGTPNIIGSDGALLAFYSDFETVETAKLMHIYFSREPIQIR